MADHSEKIELGENHRRAVSVLMRGTERACAEVLEWLEHPSSVLTEIRGDLTSSQQTQLRDLAAKLKDEIQEFTTRASLDKRKMSRRRSIAAIISAALIDLQEVQESGLRGYGHLPDVAKPVLDEHICRMAALLEQMLHIAEVD